MAWRSPHSREDRKGESSSRSRGRRPRPPARATRSRAPAVPYTTREMSRSRSVTSRRQAAISSRAMAFPARSATASRRLLIGTGDRRGRSIQERISRPPMAVLVLSSTHSSEPFFSLARMVSVSSRLRRAVRSSSMYWPEV